MSSSDALPRSSTKPAASAAMNCEQQNPAPMPRFRTFSDALSWRHRQTFWAQPSLSWLTKRRWLLQQPNSGHWLQNLLPAANQPTTQWVPVWTDSPAQALQFATESMATNVLRLAIQRLQCDVALDEVTFAAPPSAPTAWRPLDE